MAIPAKVVNITADLTKITGKKIKPMHGICQPPFFRGEPGVNPALFHYLEEAAIPYSRLHDVNHPFGGGVFVDVPNLFRSFDADPTDPQSYDFAHTDLLMKALVDYKVQPLYRLGISIENSANVKAYHVFPPKDFKKWAVICEHIIRHYNEGWANGYRLGVEYWEMWNEPDVAFDPNNIAQTWHGSREEFFEFYDVVSKHIKGCFGDSIKFGGPGVMGFKEHELWDPNLEGVDLENVTLENRWAYRIDFCHRFLAYVKEHNCPLDFFSWHGYIALVSNIIDRSKYCRALLTKYGFENTPDLLTEWNTCFRDASLRNSEVFAARDFAVLLGMQRSETSLACFYDAGIGVSTYNGFISPETYYPFRNYYVFRSFGYAYRLGLEAESQSDNRDVYTLAARDGKKAVLLIAADCDEPLTLDLRVAGADLASAQVIVTDRQYTYTLLDNVIKDGRLDIKPHSCIEIRYDLA